MLKAIAHPSALGRTAAPTDELVLFDDRHTAGVLLAQRLQRYREPSPLVLGIPRGGVPVAAAIAQALDAELDIVVARKLGAPLSAELAIGAVTADGGRYLNEEMIGALNVDPLYIERITQVQMTEAKRRAASLRGDAPPPRIAGRVVLLVDDGLATGATMIAAARAVKAQGPAQLIVAVPVGSKQARKTLAKEVNVVECLTTPEPFWAVGAHYRDFAQTEDGEVERLLHEARDRRSQWLSTAAVPAG
jgi:putative phosphoribosyl transferase